MNSIIEYSLNTPTQNNILGARLIDMLKKDNLMIGGSGDNYSNMSNCIVMMVGIIVIIIGFYLCWNKNDLTSTNGQIQNLSCDTTDYSSQCKFNIVYTVGSTQYSKVITLDKSAAPTTNTITIYYHESDPNNMSLYNYNYSVIGIVMIIIGGFVLISSICCSNNMNFIPEIKTTELNLYTESTNSNGVVYTKM